MKSNKTSIVLTLIAALTVTAAVVGCNKTATDKMGDAGQDVKDAASKTADATKDAATATKDAVTNAVGK